MKKTVAFLLSALLLLLCSCGNEKNVTETSTTEAAVYKSADMLDITNFGTSFTDCLSRFNAVLSAVKNKVQILESEHNKAIKTQNPEKYFLEENYMLTYFDPFLINSLIIAEGFEERMTEEKAKEYFAPYSNGADIRYESEGSGISSLSFISEESVKKYRVEFLKGENSFRLTALTEAGGAETVDEILEFVDLSENTYIIQSADTRCYVEFDDEGKIVYFCCSVLKNSVYDEADRIYGKNTKADRSWASSGDVNGYLSIHTYSDGILTHSECSSGPWKTVEINESDYASAFIF